MREITLQFQENKYTQVEMQDSKNTSYECPKLEKPGEWIHMLLEKEETPYGCPNHSDNLS